MKTLKLVLIILTMFLFFTTGCKPVDVVQRAREITMDKQASVIVTTEVRTYNWYGKVTEVNHWSIVIAPVDETDSIKAQERRRAVQHFLYTRK